MATAPSCSRSSSNRRKATRSESEKMAPTSANDDAAAAAADAGVDAGSEVWVLAETRAAVAGAVVCLIKNERTPKICFNITRYM